MKNGWISQVPPVLFGSVWRIDLEPEKSPEEAPDLRRAPSAGLVAGEGIGAEAQGTWTSVDATEEDSLGTGGWHCPWGTWSWQMSGPPLVPYPCREEACLSAPLPGDAGPAVSLPTQSGVRRREWLALHIGVPRVSDLFVKKKCIFHPLTWIGNWASQSTWRKPKAKRKVPGNRVAELYR